MRLFCKGEKIKIAVHAKDCVDLPGIDQRIEHDGIWKQCYPGMTSATIPAQFKDEIVAKLANHPMITYVENQITPAGIKFNDDMANGFPDVEPPPEHSRCKGDWRSVKF